jgi:hypothetical protein
MDGFFQVKGFIEKNDGTVFNESFKRVSIDKQVVIFAGFAKGTEGDEFIVIDPGFTLSQVMSSGVVKKEFQNCCFKILVHFTYLNFYYTAKLANYNMYFFSKSTAYF